MVEGGERVTGAFSAGYNGGGRSGNDQLDSLINESFSRGVSCVGEPDDLEAALTTAFRSGLELSLQARVAVS